MVAELVDAIHTATETQPNIPDRLTETTQLSMIESVREFVHSYSKETLRSLTVIERGYDENAGEVWVIVGLRKKAGAGEAK